MKAQAKNLEFDKNELEKLKLKTIDRPLFVAVSTHKGEEEIIIETHKNLKNDFPNLLTIIVPRHPNRSSEIQQLFVGLQYAVRSKKDHISAATEIYLADSLGELGIFYSLANFAFIGGSLVEVGGHNPFEAMKLNCAVISGDKVFNFKEAYADLEKQNCCVIVKSKEQLLEQVKNFLQNKKLPQELSDKARGAIIVSDNIAEKIVENIKSKIG